VPEAARPRGGSRLAVKPPEGRLWSVLRPTIGPGDRRGRALRSRAQRDQREAGVSLLLALLELPGGASCPSPPGAHLGTAVARCAGLPGREAEGCVPPSPGTGAELRAALKDENAVRKQQTIVAAPRFTSWEAAGRRGSAPTCCGPGRAAAPPRRVPSSTATALDEAACALHRPARTMRLLDWAWSGAPPRAKPGRRPRVEHGDGADSKAPPGAGRVREGTQHGLEEKGSRLEGGGQHTRLGGRGAPGLARQGPHSRGARGRTAAPGPAALRSRPRRPPRAPGSPARPRPPCPGRQNRGGTAPPWPGGVAGRRARPGWEAAGGWSAGQAAAARPLFLRPHAREPRLAGPQAPRGARQRPQPPRVGGSGRVSRGGRARRTEMRRAGSYSSMALSRSRPASSSDGNTRDRS
jgi:hypothetical protein